MKKKWVGFVSGLSTSIRFWVHMARLRLCFFFVLFFFFLSSNLIFWVLPRVWLKPIIKTRNMLAADSLSTHTHYIFTGLSHPSVCVCVYVSCVGV